MNKSINLNGEHWTVTAIKLNGFTDALDTPVHKNEFFLFEGEIEEDIFGSIFFLENELDGNAFVILVDSPDYEKAKLIVTQYTATVETTSKITILPCQKGECEAVCRNAIRETMKRAPLFAMSNTWGDCNGFSKINEEFILREMTRRRNWVLISCRLMTVGNSVAPQTPNAETKTGCAYSEMIFGY